MHLLLMRLKLYIFTFGFVKVLSVRNHSEKLSDAECMGGMQSFVVFQYVLKNLEHSDQFALRYKASKSKKAEFLIGITALVEKQ